MFRRLVSLADTDLTPADLKQVEQAADTLFGQLGIDVAFTRHFLERVNDARNKKPITVQELIRLFTEAYRKHGPKIDRLAPDQEAVLSDTKTFINLPFVIEFDARTKQLVMVAKTIMRKPDFKTPDPILRV